MTTNLPDDSHFRQVLHAIQKDRLVPFFGAGVNLANRPLVPDGGSAPKLAAWTPGQRFLPSGAELSQHLAGTYGYPEQDSWDLLRVSQYIAVESGPGALYEDLRQVFNADFPPTPVHDFFAQLPALLRERGGGKSHLLIVTTNYDDLMEQSLTAAGEPFDVVTYVADGRDSGKFRHYPPGGPPILIERPNEYRDVSLDQRHVVLKIHGAVDRASQNVEDDSYVITEDHYIDYLTRTDLTNLIPVTLAAVLQNRHFLFLGYSLRDWNLRAILHRIWGAQKLKRNSWSVQLKPQAIENKLWQRRNVEILDVSAADYIAELRRRVESLPVAGGAS
jgi:hypothetical protein